MVICSDWTDYKSVALRAQHMISNVKLVKSAIVYLLLFISKQCIIKQLLDSVFVIPRIINKVSVSIDCEQFLVFLCKFTARET